MSKEKLTVDSVVDSMYDYNSSDIRGDNKRNIIKLIKQMREEILQEVNNQPETPMLAVMEVFNKYLNEK